MVPALMLQQIIMFYGALSRLAGRLKLLVVVQVIGIVGIVGGSAALIGPWGMTGVGAAILTTDLLCVRIILRPSLGLVRDGRQDERGSSRSDAAELGEPRNVAADEPPFGRRPTSRR